MTDKPTPTDAATPECLTCSDHGAVGNILTAEPCPDCTHLNAQPAPATQQAGAEPPGIQALMCVISSLRDIAHFSDEEGGELMSALCALRDWAHAQPAPATQQAGEMEVFVLQWPGEDRINLSTVFDTEAEALDYMQNRCDTPGIRLVRFSSKAAHGPADGESK